ncbi:MAG: response regulator [Roseofilum sp. SBFL]|uniref:ATP-binding protein n=2 Tax=Roseofilum TaxID=1233426 RepID=UPI001B0C503B|nr:MULTISPECIES: ATP-binding protein [unclassified Roseofilum]MBP0039278.1 response regulator [Roseofilum sp. SID1]MBP0042493.1 response regulator [Roseofilum sp. SBFL]
MMRLGRITRKIKKGWERIRSGRIRHKIGSGYALAIGTGLAGSLIGLVVADYYQGQGIVQLADANIQAQLLVHFQVEIERAERLGVVLGTVVGDREASQLYQRKLNDNLVEIKATQEDLQTFITGNPAWLAISVDTFEPFLDRYTQALVEYSDRIQQIINQPNIGLEEQQNQLRSLVLSERQRELDQLGATLDQILATAQQQARQAEVELENAQGLEKGIIIFSSLFAVAIAGWIALGTTEDIIGPLEQLTDLAATVTEEENWQLRMPISTQDEIASLSKTLNSLMERVHQRTDQLLEAKESAERANQAKSIFLAKMSHELRTPLHAILGFTQIMVKDNTLTDKHQEQLQIIYSSSQHLLGLINDILDLSKIEAGKSELLPHDFNLLTFVHHLESMVEFKAKKKGLHLSMEVEENLPQSLYTDEQKLRQILLNLLSNAIKFTRQGNVSLTITVADRPDTLQFTVTDTGIGIASEELDQLFQPFEQTQSGKQSQEGTGLGLTISQQLVNLLGGVLSVSSEINQGSMFTFDLPLLPVSGEAEALSQVERRVTGIASTEKTYRILVVDDKWENREILHSLLTPLGFDVLQATQGEEALTLWEQETINLILTDIRMPVRDGYSMTVSIRKREQQGGLPHVPIIVTTTSTFEEERQQMLATGCNDLVHKPFLETVILEKIAQYLELEYTYESGSERDRLNNQPYDSLNDTEHYPFSKPPPLSSENPRSLLSDAMAQQPIEWIAALQKAATEADADLMLPLIDQLSTSQLQLRQQLVAWVDNFQFEVICEITEECILQESNQFIAR